MLNELIAAAHFDGASLSWLEFKASHFDYFPTEPFQWHLPNGDLDETPCCLAPTQRVNRRVRWCVHCQTSFWFPGNIERWRSDRFDERRRRTRPSLS